MGGGHILELFDSLSQSWWTHDQDTKIPFEDLNEECRVSWVISPPTLNSKRTLNDVCSIGIYTIHGWPITHLGQKFNFELIHTYSHPTFPGCSFSSSVHYGKDQCTAFLLLSTRANALAWSWLHGSLVKWKCECFFILPGETSALPESGHAVKREILEYCSTATSSVAEHQASGGR